MKLILFRYDSMHDYVFKVSIILFPCKIKTVDQEFHASFSMSFPEKALVQLMTTWI